MAQIVHIVKFKLLSFIKINSDLKLISILKNLGSFVLYTSFGIGVYLFTKTTLTYLLDEVRIGSFLLHRLMSVVLFMFFIAVNAGNIIVSYSTLYRSKEVYYLAAKPISFTKIFLIKFLDNFFYSSTTMLLMITAVMVAYTYYFKLDFFFAVIFFFFMLPFVLIAASFGVILLMLMIRVSYKVGLKKVVMTLVLIYAASMILYFRFSNPVSLVEHVMAFYPNINGYFGSLDNFALKFLPNFWIADSLYWFTSGKPLNALPYLIFLNSAAAVFLVTTIAAAKKLYFRTWHESIELKLKNGQMSKSASKKQRHSRAFFSPQIDVLLKKEYFQFFREPGQWIHLAVIIFLIIIFIVSLGGIDEKLLNAYTFSLKSIIYLVIFSFNLFLISSLSLRFAFPALSLEGEAYWKLKSSPVSMKKMMVIKFAILFSVIFLLGQGLNYFSHKSFPHELYLTSSINVGFITLAIVSLNFAMGSLFINLKEKSPIRLASSQGASLTFLFTLLFLIFIIGVLFIPIYNYYNDIFGYQQRLKNIYYTSLLISSLSLFISLSSFSITSKMLKRDL